MNPQFGVPNFGIPSYDQMRAAFNSIGQQQQQMWNQYQQFQIFCQTRGLNPSDQNSFNLFYNQLVSNIGQQQPQQPQVFSQPQQPQIFNQPQQPQIFNQPQFPQVFPQPQPRPVFPQPQQRSVFPQPQRSQTFPQPQNFIPQIPHGIPPGQGGGNNANEPYIHGGDLHELHPKPDNSSYINQNPSDIINIAFKAGSRYNDVILTIPGNITIREMFQRYVEKLGISQNALQGTLQFLYNGAKIDTFSNDLVCNHFKNGINITVFDQS